MTNQAQTPEKVDLSKYVEKRFFEDRPHIRGRRVPIATIAHSAGSQNWSVAELAYQFTLTESEVLAALLYYQENRDLIEVQEAAEQRKLDETYLRNQ